MKMCGAYIVAYKYYNWHINLVSDFVTTQFKATIGTVDRKINIVSTSLFTMNTT